VKTKRLFVSLMIFVLLLGGLGCARSQPTATPAPQVTPAPTATASPTPTLTPAPTAAASPTLTPTRTPGQASDTTPPSIGDILLWDCSTTQASLSWTTNEPATTQMEWGPTPEYGMVTPLDKNLVTTHSVTLIGLEAFRTYHFRARAKDAAGNEAMSEDHNFTASWHTSWN